MTTYDDFVSNFVSGVADCATGHDYASAHEMLNRNARFPGYAEGWDVYESGNLPDSATQAQIEYAADEVWAQREY